MVGVGKAMAEGGGVYSAQRWLKAYDELKCRWWILRVTTHAFTLAASRTATHTCAAAALLAHLHPRMRRYNCAHALASSHCWPTLARPHPYRAAQRRMCIIILTYTFAQPVPYARSSLSPHNP